MNIFASDYSPARSAQNLDDKRVIKMILESAQLMSTAMHVLNIPTPPYRVTHLNHPCARWARETRENYRWLLRHFAVLCHEYFLRYGRNHKCEDLYETFIEAAQYIPEGPLTSFPNCTIFKQEKSVVVAYRLALKHKWANDKRPPKWTSTNPPDWAQKGE